MPHVSVKMIKGRSEKQKQMLADRIVKAIIAIAGCGEQAVSVNIEEVKQADWTEDVYERDIVPKWDNPYKKPAYTTF